MKKTVSSRKIFAWKTYDDACEPDVSARSMLIFPDPAMRSERLKQFKRKRAQKVCETEFNLAHLSGEELKSLAWVAVAYWANDELEPDKTEALEAIEMSLVEGLNAKPTPEMEVTSIDIIRELLDSIDKNASLQRLHKQQLDNTTLEVKKECQLESFEYGLSDLDALVMDDLFNEEDDFEI